MPYEQCDDEVRDIIDTAIANWHRERLHLEKVKDVRIDCLFYIPKTNEAGEIVGPPLRLHGYNCAATIKVIGEKQRAQGLGDALITIDAEQWKFLSDKSRLALIDHELEHLERVLKKEVPADDDQGRPRLRCKIHDWQLGGFRCIAERHREHALDTMNAQQFVTDHGQLLFGFAGPLAMGDAAGVSAEEARAVTSGRQSMMEGASAAAAAVRKGGRRR